VWFVPMVYGGVLPVEATIKLDDGQALLESRP
jgi:hypothetical protein